MQIEKSITFESEPGHEEIQEAIGKLQTEILSEIDEDELRDKKARFVVSFKEKEKKLILRVEKDDEE